MRILFFLVIVSLVHQLHQATNPRQTKWINVAITHKSETSQKNNDIEDDLFEKECFVSCQIRLGGPLAAQLSEN